MAEYEHEYILALDNLPHVLSDIGDYLDYINVRTKKYMGNTLGERIVRCRDCKHSTEEGVYTECYFCHLDRWNTNPIEAPLVESDGYCAWGERKVVE